MEARFVNVHLRKAVTGTSFNLLDITSMSEFRADAHPSSTGGKKHDDCMHWCLPGITDIWNDLFIAKLEYLKVRTRIYPILNFKNCSVMVYESIDQKFMTLGLIISGAKMLQGHTKVYTNRLVLEIFMIYCTLKKLRK